MAYIGIDYGMGQTNRDPENGIRFGVISQGTVGQAWYDEAEADYGKPTCPKCGYEVIYRAGYLPIDDDKLEQYSSHGCADYVCSRCMLSLDSSDCFGEEPVGWNYDSDGYVLQDCLDSDIMVLKSPYYTFAQFCSPCVPGAGNLDNAMDDGAKSYCLGHDWFEEGKAPYRVFSVETNQEVLAP